MSKVKNSELQRSDRGIGFVGLLTLIFITLKLTNYIAWSWWWVLSPIWITVLVCIVIFFIVVLVLLIKECFS